MPLPPREFKIALGKSLAPPPQEQISLIPLPVPSFSWIWDALMRMEQVLRNTQSKMNMSPPKKEPFQEEQKSSNLHFSGDIYNMLVLGRVYFSQMVDHDGKIVHPMESHPLNKNTTSQPVRTLKLGRFNSKYINFWLNLRPLKVKKWKNIQDSHFELVIIMVFISHIQRT